MKKYVLVALIAGIASTPALAAKFQMHVTPGPQQVSRMESGVAAVDDVAPGSSVRLVETDGDFKKRASIGVVVMNQGTTPFNFGPENITATLADGTSVPIITYEQLAHEERRRETWAAIAAGLSAMSNSMSAANSGWYHGTATYSGSTYGSFGTTPYSANTYGTASVTGYNAGQAQVAQSIANQENEASFARLAEQNAANKKALKGYMRTTTVDAQEMFGGSIFFDLPKAAYRVKGDVPVTFVVTVNGEQHRFSALLHRL
jgi:hypothetical protein